MKAGIKCAIDISHSCQADTRATAILRGERLQFFGADRNRRDGFASSLKTAMRRRNGDFPAPKTPDPGPDLGQALALSMHPPRPEPGPGPAGSSPNLKDANPSIPPAAPRSFRRHTGADQPPICMLLHLRVNRRGVSGRFACAGPAPARARR